MNFVAAKMRKGLKKVDFALIVLLLVCAGLGCSKQKSTIGPTAVGTNSMAWTNLLQVSRPIILTGTWMQAESSFNGLTMASYTDEEIAAWMKLQVEIIEQTAADPYKGALRRGAIQQMYYHPRASRPYAGWLKECLRTNRFADDFVARTARELLARLGESDAGQ